MRMKVKTPVLSVVVPEVKLVLMFLITTETPERGSLLLLLTKPLTRLGLSWENNAEVRMMERRKRRTNIGILDLMGLHIIWLQF